MQNEQLLCKCRIMHITIVSLQEDSLFLILTSSLTDSHHTEASVYSDTNDEGIMNPTLVSGWYNEQNAVIRSTAIVSIHTCAHMRALTHTCTHSHLRMNVTAKTVIKKVCWC